MVELFQKNFEIDVYCLLYRYSSDEWEAIEIKSSHLAFSKYNSNLFIFIAMVKTMADQYSIIADNLLKDNKYNIFCRKLVSLLC